MESVNILPKGWAKCSIGELINVTNGYAFRSKDYSHKGIAIVRISDIQEGKIYIKDSARIPESKANLNYKIGKGDLLIALSGATTGKVGVFVSDEVALQNQRVGNFKIKNEKILTSGYRNYFILSLRKQIELAAYGGAQPNISTSELEEFNIPLPPLNEQNRIVAKLDKLLSKVETAKARLDTIPQIIKRFRQSVLSAAVSGELTKDGRDENNITINSWLETKLDSLAQSTFYGPRFSSSEYVEDGIPSIRTTDFTSEGRIELYDPPKLFLTDTQIEKYKVIKNDLLITRSGSIGKLAIFKGDYIAIPSAYLIRLRLKENVNPDFSNRFLSLSLCPVFLSSAECFPIFGIRLWRR